MMSTSGSYPLFVRCSVVVLGSVLSPLYSSHIKGKFPCRKVSLDKATTTGGCQETGGGEGWFVLSLPLLSLSFITQLSSHLEKFLCFWAWLNSLAICFMFGGLRPDTTGKVEYL
jgi:hypothetical protein